MLDGGISLVASQYLDAAFALRNMINAILKGYSSEIVHDHTIDLAKALEEMFSSKSSESVKPKVDYRKEHDRNCNDYTGCNAGCQWVAIKPQVSDCACTESVPCLWHSWVPRIEK